MGACGRGAGICNWLTVYATYSVGDGQQWKGGEEGCRQGKGEEGWRAVEGGRGGVQAGEGGRGVGKQGKGGGGQRKGVL